MTNSSNEMHESQTQSPNQMQIEYIDRYDKHGCSFVKNPGERLGLIEYGKFANRGFNQGWNEGGLLDKLEEAKALMKKHHPNTTVLLSIPDLLFRIPNKEMQSGDAIIT